MPEYTSEMTPEFEASLRRNLRTMKQFELNDPAVLDDAPTPDGPTMTAGELVARLMKLSADTPVIGYSDRTDYVNVVDIAYSPDNGPAAVLELSWDYDSRQW